MSPARSPDPRRRPPPRRRLRRLRHPPRRGLDVDATDLATDANLLALPLPYFPVPWMGHLPFQPPPTESPSFVAEREKMAAMATQLGLPVLLELSPTAMSGDRYLAEVKPPTGPLYNMTNYVPVCGDHPGPDAASVKTAYLAFVEEMIDALHPKYLAIGWRVNVFADDCPTQWPTLKALLNATYAAVKQAHPKLTVFDTFDADALWAATPGGACGKVDRDCLTRRLAAYGDLRTDLFALSAHPLALLDAGTLPDDYLTIFGKVTGLPVAITDTDLPGAPLAETLNTTRCAPALAATDATRTSWVERVIADGTAAKMPFVVWSTDRALVPAADAAPCACGSATNACQRLGDMDPFFRGPVRALALSSLRAAEGSPTPALAKWQAGVKAAAP